MSDGWITDMQIRTEFLQWWLDEYPLESGEFPDRRYAELAASPKQSLKPTLRYTPCSAPIVLKASTQLRCRLHSAPKQRLFWSTKFCKVYVTSVMTLRSRRLPKPGSICIPTWRAGSS